MASAPTTPLFVKTHDFIVWLFHHSARAPKRLRHSYTQRVESSALEFEATILRANAARDEKRGEFLSIADGELAVLRSLLRYSVDFQLLDRGSERHAIRCLDELGRLLGAWLAATARSPVSRR